MSEKEEFCERIHCRHHPNAQEPFEKMKSIELDDLTLEYLDALAKQTGLNRSCFMCASIHTLVNMPIEDVLKILRGAKKHE